MAHNWAALFSVSSRCSPTPPIPFVFDYLCLRSFATTGDVPKGRATQMQTVKSSSVGRAAQSYDSCGTSGTSR
ncbi:hypothetical protein SESBI_32731 [Sesbania bispinosa]|nr:hypothetical protein SESBI_32731 [Sesbania bispinosa]